MLSIIVLLISGLQIRAWKSQSLDSDCSDVCLRGGDVIATQFLCPERHNAKSRKSDLGVCPLFCEIGHFCVVYVHFYFSSEGTP